MHLLVGSSSHRVWVILNIVPCYSSVLYHHVTLHLAAFWLQVGGEWSSVGWFTGLSGQPFLCLAVLLIKHLYFLSGGMRLNRCCPRWDKWAAVFWVTVCQLSPTEMVGHSRWAAAFSRLPPRHDAVAEDTLDGAVVKSHQQFLPKDVFVGLVFRLCSHHHACQFFNLLAVQSRLLRWWGNILLYRLNTSLDDVPSDNTNSLRTDLHCLFIAVYSWETATLTLASGGTYTAAMITTVSSLHSTVSASSVWVWSYRSRASLITPRH